jgi:hypothetical protein
MRTGAIVEAIDLVAGDPPSVPLSLGVAPGEIVGLLFPPARPRAPVLRALAGLDAAVAGEVRLLRHKRIEIAPSGKPLSTVLSSQPDLVLLDAAEERADRGMWAQLASGRARGTSFVVATASVDQACRGDRVSLASWEMDELTRAMQQLVRRMNSQVQEFLAVLGEARARDARTGSMAADLRRLNVGSRALLAEMRRCASARTELLLVKSAAAQVASACVSDRLLDAIIGDARGRKES